MSRARLMVMLCALGAWLGCVQLGHAGTKELPTIEATLVITRVEGTATLQWESDPRALYTVVYAARRDAKAKWQPLPGYVKLRGNGERITITDKIPPGETRYYRLHVEPITFE
ncbi:MAG: hypothetical protein JXB04_11845 [Kiritimatiellae bacterium]|nr:hypothetical protein [Kiritimatiellia bacterium]